MSDESKLFELKKLPDGNIVADVNRSKTISPYNRAKHLKRANLPALCNQCVYRSIEDGGNGKCPKYQKDSACIIRSDLQKICNKLDSRDPEQLKEMLDILAKIEFENVLFALYASKLDGNIPDRTTTREINTLLKIVSTINELRDKIEMKETRMLDEKGLIKAIFQEAATKKVMDSGKN